MAVDGEFRIPRDGETFIHVIRDRCQDLIDAGIWEGLDVLRLDAWMQNFQTSVERYFAACVLDALIYRSDAQTVSLMHQLFQRTLPDLIRHDPPDVDAPEDWYEALSCQHRQEDPKIRIVPVLRANDPPTKSGLLLARLYRRRLAIEERWMIWPWRIERAKNEGIRIFLFVDDFLGTGHQFEEFANQFGLPGILSGCYAVYAPLVAHHKGVAYLRSKLPSLRVQSVELLDDGYNLFSQDSLWFRDQDNVNTPALARLFYERLIEKRQLPIGQAHSTGYGQLAIAYSFEHATPDNCLPILWIKTPDWNSLLER